MAFFAAYGVSVEWGSAAVPGAFVIGRSTIGGTDKLGSAFDTVMGDVAGGRERPIEVVIDRTVDQQGTCRVTIFDPHGSYNPANPDAAHAPSVVPMRRLVVTATTAAAGDDRVPRDLGGGVAGQRYLFSGYTSRIRHDDTPGVQATTVEAVDGLEVVSLARPLVPEMGPTTVGAAARAVLLGCGVADADMALGTGVALGGFSADGTRTGVELLTELMTIEQGHFYVAADGRFVLEDRAALTAAVQPSATLDGTYFGTSTPEVDKQEILNSQTVTRTVPAGGTPGAPQTYRDADSVRRYFERAGSAISSDWLPDDDAARALATYVVLTHREPVVRVRNASLPGLTAQQVALQVAADLGTRVAVRDTRGGTRTAGFVRRVQHRIANRAHTTQLDVERLVFEAFTIGVSTIGGTDLIAA